jgi:hypothetical protein
MEENTIVPPTNSADQDTNYSPGKQLMVGVGVMLFLVVAGIFAYTYIHANALQSNNAKNVKGASTNQISPAQWIGPTPQSTNETTTNNTSASNSNPVPSGTQSNTKACSKNGPAQKWDYLVPYVVKDGDTLQSIATTQLNDANRVNEILQLNGQGPYVVGSTIYLPPSSITKSSGNIKEVFGMLVKKDSSYWQLSYSSDPKGLGILIPSFWFNDISNAESYGVGDCITVLFDDGNKVFSVASQ